MNIEEVVEAIKKDGYYIYTQNVKKPKTLMKRARGLCSSENYKRGGNYRGNFSMDAELKSLVTSPEVEKIFAEFEAAPQEIFITYEVNAQAMTRNNYLHFDRLRCLKSLVYLEDVDEKCGPFTIAPGSHLKGAELRKKFKNYGDYETIANRIDIDYPEIEYTLLPIVGPVGTTVLFDTDLFHMGGSVEDGHSRTVIRSHWYKNHAWRKA